MEAYLEELGKTLDVIDKYEKSLSGIEVLISSDAFKSMPDFLKSMHYNKYHTALLRFLIMTTTTYYTMFNQRICEPPCDALSVALQFELDKMQKCKEADISNLPEPKSDGDKIIYRSFLLTIIQNNMNNGITEDLILESHEHRFVMYDLMRKSFDKYVEQRS